MVGRLDNMSNSLGYLSFSYAQFHGDELVHSPEFRRDTWPFLSTCTGEVWIFKNRSWGRRRTSFSFGDQRCSHFYGIGRLDELSPDDVGEVRSLSFYGGHMNVLYSFTTQQLAGHLRRWQVMPEIGRLADLPLQKVEIEALECFLSGGSADRLMITCGADGDPLFTLGARHDLLRVLDYE